MPEKEKKKAGRPRKFKELEEFKTKIEKYFQKCDEKDEPYLIEGLALHLGINSEQLRHMETMETYPIEFRQAIEKAKLRILFHLAHRLVKSRGNTAGLIFYLKNAFGWADKQELAQTGEIVVRLQGFEEYAK